MCEELYVTESVPQATPFLRKRTTRVRKRVMASVSERDVASS